MRLRTRQFACLLILLSAFGAVDSIARAAGDPCTNCASVRILLLQIASVGAARPTSSPLSNLDETSAPTASTHANLPWAMSPPAAQTAALHAVTGSGL